MLVPGEYAVLNGWVGFARRSRIQPTGYHVGIEGRYCASRPGFDHPIVFGKELDCDLLRQAFECRESDEILIEPGRIYLLVSEEYFKLPRDVAAFVSVRSSLARLGVMHAPTFIDPGFEGRLVLEVYSFLPVVLHASDEVVHVNFVRVEEGGLAEYNGVYRGQSAIRIRNCDLF